MRKWIQCMLMGVGLLTFSASSFAWERLFDFESDQEGTPPEGFIIDTALTGKPTIMVVKDEDVLKKSQFLLVKGAGQFGENKVLCLVWFSDIKNGKVSFKLRHLGLDAEPRMGGVVWRYDGKSDLYLMKCDMRDQEIRFVWRHEGDEDVIEKKSLKFPAMQWVSLAVEFRDNEVEFFEKDVSLFKAKDSHIQNSGKVGLYVESDEALFFDDLKIVSYSN